MIKIVIPLPPITKKNHQQIVKAKGHYMVIPSKQYREYENKCSAFITQSYFIEKPVNVKCLYYMPTHRRVDLTNLMEATHDILTKYKVLADDNSNVIVSVDGSRVLYDKDHPRTEIYIEDMSYEERKDTEISNT